MSPENKRIHFHLDLTHCSAIGHKGETREQYLIKGRLRRIFQPTLPLGVRASQYSAEAHQSRDDHANSINRPLGSSSQRRGAATTRPRPCALREQPNAVVFASLKVEADE
eukprot:c19470_g1_i9.p1 GENE.c19470_g1_i9~~c19470_g1_i9.p1  ORF type:complete len:110 (+),score=3.99 c19470_g1_i9:232-561(+)